MAHSRREVKMNLDDVAAIETVFANLSSGYKMSINVAETIYSLKRKEHITENGMNALIQQYVVKPEVSSALKIITLNAFLWHVVSFLSFTKFLSVFEDAGYTKVCELLCKYKGIVFRTVHDGRRKTANRETNALIAVQRVLASTIPRAVPKRELPHAENIRKYYIKLKILADNNGFPSGTRVELSNRISEINSLIEECQSPSRKQYLIDKLAVTFLLLTQQYADCSERNRVLQRLHDSMPHDSDVDRTMYDTIFHSFKAINWASRGNYPTAAKHIQLAKFACNHCLSPFPSVVANTGAHIMRSEGSLHRWSCDSDCQSEQDYIYALRLANDLTEEERSVWVNVIMIRRASSLLGFDLFSRLNDNEVRPDSKTIEQARTILTKIRQCRLPLQNRQQLVLYLCIGRLHDLEGDILNAEKYIKKALTLVDEGTFDTVEKANINEYLSRLSSVRN